MLFIVRVADKGKHENDVQIFAYDAYEITLTIHENISKLRNTKVSFYLQLKWDVVAYDHENLSQNLSKKKIWNSFGQNN